VDNFVSKVATAQNTFQVKEMSFMEYKKLCQKLLFVDDLPSLVRVFNDVIDSQVVGKKPANVIEKTLILLYIRSLTIGDDIRLILDDKEITTSVDLFFQAFNKKYDLLEYECNGFKLQLGPPANFIASSNIMDCIKDSIANITTANDEDFEDITPENRDILVDHIIAFPVKDAIEKLIKMYGDFKYKVTALNDYQISIYDSSILNFLKIIFDGDYSTVLDLEYHLRKHLGYNYVDLENTPYAETKVMITKYKEEIEQQSKTADTGKIDEPV
jgi:hypothetical protein